MIFSDDIGSYPLPAGVDRDGLRATAFALAEGTGSPDDGERFNAVVAELMASKVRAGLSCPNYPQVQEMIDGFFNLIEAYSEPEEPFVVLKDKAVLPELDAVEGVARAYAGEKGEPLKLRVCVTGPLELYVKRVSTQVDPDLLLNLGRSVGRFLENSILGEPHVKTHVVSLDEPSWGLNPNIVVDEDALVQAWDAAAEPARNLDVQVHLHSSAECEAVGRTKHIKVIGVEAAEDPGNLASIDPKLLEEHDLFLRVGVARTNSAGLAADFMQETGQELWAGEERALEYLGKVESPEVIAGRIRQAVGVFGDRVKYVGPDCGMGLWPSMKAAERILANTAAAVSGI